MAYLNFTKIAPPAPNDPVVNEITQINNNWDHLEAKLAPYVVGGSISDIETGQETFDLNFRFAVWDGAAQVIPDDIDASWSAWTALPILAPRVARASFTPRWRSNSAYRMVELAGGVLFNAAADPWTMGSAFQINQLAAGSPASSFVPIGGALKAPCATALTGGTSVVAGAAITVDSSGGFVRINAQFMGGGGGGNFIELDQVWWWY